MSSLSDFFNAFSDVAPTFSTASSDTSGIIIILCLIGAKFLAEISDRETLIEMGISFSALYVGATLALMVGADIILPVDTVLMQQIIVSSMGMTIAGLLLMVGFRRTDARI